MWHGRQIQRNIFCESDFYAIEVQLFNHTHEWRCKMMKLSTYNEIIECYAIAESTGMCESSGRIISRVSKIHRVSWGK